MLEFLNLLLEQFSNNKEVKLFNKQKVNELFKNFKQ